jgi:hypothetical protein
LSDGVVTAFACPFLVSATQSSIPRSRTFAKASFEPSGEKPMVISFEPGGSEIGRSGPSTDFRVTANKPGRRCGPLVRGLMRPPPIRYIGWESSAIDGIGWRRKMASVR